MENQFIINGKIKTILPAEEVGTHTKYTVLLAYGNKDTEVVVDFWNGNGDALVNFTEGQEVSVQYTPKSKGHNGRWYTSLSANSIAPYTF